MNMTELMDQSWHFWCAACGRGYLTRYFAEKGGVREALAAHSAEWFKWMGKGCDS